MTTGLPPALAARPYRGIIDDAMSGMGTWVRGAYVSLESNRFQLINAAGAQVGQPSLSLDVIVVGANPNTSKRYYPVNSYDPNSTAPPTCFSDNGIGPSSQALEPQSPTCALCPQNAPGSKVSQITGNRVKACQDRKKLAVIIPGDPAVNVYLFDVPPNGLTNMKKYFRFLQQQDSGDPNRPMDAADVITRLTFADPKNLGCMTWQPVGYTDDAHTLSIMQYVEENKLTDQTVGRFDVAAEPEVVKMALAARANGPAPLPPPQAQAAPQQFTMPPRTPPRPQVQTQPPWAIQPPQAQEAPASAPKRGRKPKALTEQAAPSPAAPFMAAPQAQQPAPPPDQGPPQVLPPYPYQKPPQQPALPSYQPQQPAPPPYHPAPPERGVAYQPHAPQVQESGIPSFLKRDPVPPPPQFMQHAPPPLPPDMKAQLQEAMNMTVPN